MTDDDVTRRDFLASTGAFAGLGLGIEWPSFWNAGDLVVQNRDEVISEEIATVIAGEGLKARMTDDYTATLTATDTSTTSKEVVSKTVASDSIPRQHKPERYTPKDRAGVLTLSTPSCKHLDITGVHAVVAGHGLSVVNISNPTDMKEVGTIPHADLQAYGVTVWNDIAYTTEMSSSLLTAVDVSDPTAPEILGSAAVGEPRKVTIQGEYAYCSSKATTGEFHVVDISTPGQPQHVTSIADPKFERSFEIAIQGNYAFIVGRKSDAVTAVDISDPTAPTIVGSYTGTPLIEPYGIYIQDQYGIVTLSDNGHGIAILDISDPTAITSVGSVTGDGTTINSPYGIDVDGHYAYTANKDSDTYTAWDITDPANPSIVSSVNPGSYDQPYDVAAKDGFAFSVTRGNDNIHALGMRDRKW